MSTLEVNKITPVSGGTTVQVGESGDTINIPAGATIANAGTATGFGVSLANGADNRVVTASSASALNGEANLRFDGSTVRVGSGTTSPDADGSDVVVEGSGNTGISIFSGGTNSANLYFGTNGANNDGLIRYDNDGNNLKFYTQASERMRIHGGAVDSDKVSIGTSNAVGGLHVMYNALDSTSQGTITVTANNSGNSTGILFLDGQNQNCGRITVKGGDNTSQFYTSSDHRLKQDVAPLDSSLETIKSLQPKKYKWNTNPDSGYHEGFLAHELQSLVPDAVTGKHNEVDSEGNPIYQGVDKTAIIPHLTKALQEAITKIETLEAKVAALESA